MSCHGFHGSKEGEEEMDVGEICVAVLSCSLAILVLAIAFCVVYAIIE